MNEKNLYIFPTLEADGKITFTLSETPVDPGKGKPPPTIHLPKDSQKTKFLFQIKNRKGMKVKFKEDWVWAGEDCTCPPAKGINTDQIIAVFRRNDTQAEFDDRNNGKERFIVYQLNMENEGVDCPLDPEIKNGGGTGNLTAYYAIGGALVGAAISVFTNTALVAQNLVIYAIIGAALGFVFATFLSKR